MKYSQIPDLQILFGPWIQVCVDGVCVRVCEMLWGSLMDVGCKSAALGRASVSVFILVMSDCCIYPKCQIVLFCSWISLKNPNKQTNKRVNRRINCDASELPFLCTHSYSYLCYLSQLWHFRSVLTALVPTPDFKLGRTAGPCQAWRSGLYVSQTADLFLHNPLWWERWCLGN